jgi:hypothetical protein
VTLISKQSGRELSQKVFSECGRKILFFDRSLKWDGDEEELEERKRRWTTTQEEVK